MKRIRIFIADDHEVIRDGVRALLEKSDKYKVVGEASNGDEAFAKIAELKPEIIIMDISMPGTNGIEATRAIREHNKESKIIILSMHTDADHISACLSLDVAGYVVKTHGGKEIIASIEAVHEGKKFYSEEVTQAILGQYRESTRPQPRAELPTAELTAREKEVLTYIAQGLTNQKIADKLFLSFRTIETHRANLMRKLEVKNSIELINKARALKIIE